jgi:hypothetical protein
MLPCAMQADNSDTRGEDCEPLLMNSLTIVNEP